MIPTKYIAVAVIVVIIVLWFYLRSERMTPKSGGKGKKKAATGNKSSNKSGKSKTRTAPKRATPAARAESAEDESDDESDHEDTSGDLSGAELYKLVHSGMCRGMTEDEFRAAAPQYAQAMVYVELLQKHTLKGTVTVRDYEDVVNMELQD